jgi:hypothetical protein
MEENASFQIRYTSLRKWLLHMALSSPELTVESARKGKLGHRLVVSQLEIRGES